MENKYQAEVKQKWGATNAYEEYEKITKNYSKDKWKELSLEMNNIFKSFSDCMINKESFCSEKTQSLVKKLQNYITNNYYTCTNEILYGLGQMYVNDERFKENIDQHYEGTSYYVYDAIKYYCNL